MAVPDMCDVAIVGAGPAGSTCAWRLKDSELDVRLIDKASFPRDKICAGWVTPSVINSLEIDVEQYSVGRVLQPIRGFRVGMIDGPVVETHYEHIVSYGIRRCEFDEYLRQRSAVSCQLNDPVRRIEQVNGRWHINDELRARVLVGAAGHFCPVGRMLRSRESQKPSVVRAQEIEFAIPAGAEASVAIDPENPELFFCRDLKGYGWCFRKGSFLNVGLGRLDPDRLPEHVRNFSEFLTTRRRLGVPIPERWHGHAYRVYEHARPQLFADGVVLIGDSAGLAHPQSGEGIRPAIESGILAAETILSCNGSYSAARLADYEAKIRQRFGRPRHRSAFAWLPNRWMAALGARLLATHWFSRHVVLDRWFLHTHQPTLTTTGE